MFEFGVKALVDMILLPFLKVIWFHVLTMIPSLLPAKLISSLTTPLVSQIW